MTFKRTSFAWLLGLAIFAGISCSKSGDSDEPQPDDEPFTYESSSEIFPNPERGFIKTMIVKSGEAGLAQSQLNQLRGQNVSMILRLFYFDGYKDKPLDAAALDLLTSDLAKIREAGLKAVLRFAYTDDMAGTDAPLNIVEAHIDQLKPIFADNEDVIAFVQAGFIGAWGEWHSSSNGLATAENRRAVVNKLLEALPPAIMVQVRTPGHKQEILNTTNAVTDGQAYTNVAAARIGHHNDCFLSGGTDYGTYTNVAAEKQYISQEAQYVPTGGETCPPTGGFNPTCIESRNEMKLLKWTYLNLDWYPPTIAAWRNSGCFDEFQTNLGYRLALSEAAVPEPVAAGGSLRLNVSVTNKGYAPLYHKKDASLVLKNKATGAYHEFPLAVDLRTCKPGGTLKIEESVSLSNVPAGTYGMFLRVADRAATLRDRPEYAIRFANKDVWVEENGGMNSLRFDLTIQ